MKTHVIKISNYFELIKPAYTYIKITPDKSIRNFNSVNIAKAITHTWRNLNKKIHFEKKKLFFETDFKISYIVDIKNGNAEFYFMIPIPFMTVLLEKIREIWPKARIDEVEGLDPFSKDAAVYQLNYKKEDALSIQVDKKSNEPLNQILNVIEIMKDDDRVTIIYNFLPRTQFGWLKEYTNTVEKFKKNKPVDKEKMTVSYIARVSFNIIVELLEQAISVFIDFTGGPTKKNNIAFTEALATALDSNNIKELSPASKRKKELRVVDTQIAVVSYSEDSTRKDNNALAVCQAYRVLDEDNELTYKKAKKVPILIDYKFDKIESNVMSTDECQNFIQVPGRSLLRQFNIPHIQVEEKSVPDRLQSGYISLGISSCRGSKAAAYFEDDYDIGSMPLLLVGAQGSGKSTFIANYCYQAHSRGEGIFILDFIKNCELSDAICKAIPESDRVVLELHLEKDVQGLGFNEIKITNDMLPYDRLDRANLQAQQTLALVDAVNPAAPLSSQMRRYLSAACNVVYALGYTSIRDVVNCLESHIKRHRYIDELSGELKAMLEDEINDLYSMDEWAKETKDRLAEITGTKVSKLEFIMDRIAMLKEDFKLKYMFNKSTDGNIELVELMEQGKVVIIKMPQSEFPTKMIKNVLITYWLSKKWLSDQIRGKMHAKPRRTHTIIDEIFQAPTCMEGTHMLPYILPQSRKFGSRMVFSTQYMKQIDPIDEALRASGCSYMFLKGTSEEDFKKFENDLEGFEYEDLRDMNNDNYQRYSLNLVYYSRGYASFITKLPPPVK